MWFYLRDTSVPVLKEVTDGDLVYLVYRVYPQVIYKRLTSPTHFLENLLSEGEQGNMGLLFFIYHVY